jgi:hypothetical protein
MVLFAALLMVDCSETGCKGGTAVADDDFEALSLSVFEELLLCCFREAPLLPATRSLLGISLFARPAVAFFA